jgi:glycosyltransferase involved in cell wall biosynthesis
LFLGTLKPSKNIEGLIEAFSIINHQSSIILVVAGKKGWLYESVFEKVEKLGLKNKVIFTDFIPEDEVSTLIQGATLFVMPSFWEGFGMPALEAMAMGTPVVVSNVASLPEVVGEAGILVDPYDTQKMAEAIKNVLESKSLYNKLREKGLKRARKFTWQRCAKKSLEVLENVATD